MLDPKKCVDNLLSNNFDGFVGVPCSNLSSLIEELESRGLYKNLANEGDCIAYAVGQYLAGRKVGVLMQNSGFANALNPITSLAKTYDIPLYMIIGDRGHKGDEPQHLYTRDVVYELVDFMGYEVIDNIESSNELYSDKGWVTFIEKGELPPKSDIVSSNQGLSIQSAVDTLASHLSDLDVVVASTGYIGRRLLSSRDRYLNFYMVGSMGLATSIASGIRDGYNKGRVIALDGDGAVLMRPDSVISAYSMSDFTHIILDNNSYESTGNQSRLDINLSAMLEGMNVASGRSYVEVSDLSDMEDALEAGVDTILVNVDSDLVKLPRPDRSPIESKELFIDTLKKFSMSERYRV